MQVNTITQIKKFKLEFEKFDDWVYIIGGGRKKPYLLPRKHFDEMEAKHSKGKNHYNWLLRLARADVYVALSEEYLKQYSETGGYYEPTWNTWIVNPLPLLRANVKDRYYQASMEDGFLHLDGKPVRCPFIIELNNYHSIHKVVKILQKNSKILSAEIKDVPVYNQDMYGKQYIHVIYLPSVKEFNKLIAETSVRFDMTYNITQRLNIKKFKVDDY